MRETRLYGSEGGEAKAFPTPIGVIMDILDLLNEDIVVQYPLRVNTFLPHLIVTFIFMLLFIKGKLA